MIKLTRCSSTLHLDRHHISAIVWQDWFSFPFFRRCWLHSANNHLIILPVQVDKGHPHLKLNKTFLKWIWIKLFLNEFGLSLDIVTNGFWLLYSFYKDYLSNINWSAVNPPFVSLVKVSTVFYENPYIALFQKYTLYSLEKRRLLAILEISDICSSF